MKKLLSILLAFAALAGMASAAVCVRLDEGALLLNEDGSEIVALGKYDDIVSLGQGFFAAQQDGLWALMDGDGRLRTDFLYDAFRFEDTCLSARRDNLWGMISTDGEEYTSFAYTRLEPVGDGRFWGIRGEPYDLESDEIFSLGTDGEKATGLFVRRMGEPGGGGLLPVLRSTGLWGWCDAEGEMIVPARYDEARGFAAGLAVAAEQGFVGVIDASGRSVVPAEYDHVEVSPSGFILACRTGEGAWILSADGSERFFFPGEETAAALMGDGFGVYDGEYLKLYDAEGNLVEALGQGASASEGLQGQIILSEGGWGEACVRLSGTQQTYQNLYPLGTARGEAIYACMRANAARSINDLLGEVQTSVDMDSARYGVVDSAGNEILSPQYEEIFFLGDDRLLTREGSYYQMIDASGTVYWSHGIRQTEEPSF